MLARIRKSTEEKDQGFTLIELLVVIIIIGILAAIAIPTFLNQRNKGYDAQAKSDVRNLQIEVETAYNDANVYPASAPSYKKSDSTQNAGYQANDTAYCISVQSKSNKFWKATSFTPGVVEATAACAATDLTP